MRSTPYKIQRFIRGPEYLDFDFMGFAEFHQGALVECRKVMKAESGSYVVKKLISGDKEIWFVGPESREAMVQAFFEQELGYRPNFIPIDSPHRLKAPPHLREAYNEPTFPDKVVGWWGIDEGLEFGLFKMEEDAVDFLKYIRE